MCRSESELKTGRNVDVSRWDFSLSNFKRVRTAVPHALTLVSHLVMPVFLNIFPWRNPKTIFHIPRTSHLWQCLQAPCSRKKKRIDVNPLWPLAAQKLLFYVEGYLDFTRYSNLFLYLFIPRFLVEHLTTICINLVGKHWVFDMGFVP